MKTTLPKTAIFLYLPVIHQGYRRFFRQHRVEQIYLLGEDLISQYRFLVKDLRALSPQENKKALLALQPQLNIEIVDESRLRQGPLSRTLILLDDDVSHILIDKYPHLATKIVWQTMFLRYDRRASLKKDLASADRQIKKEQLPFWPQVKAEAAKSGDWWRQVGAALMADGQIVLQTHNHHLPNEQQPYIEGDPRANFHRGEHIDKTTAIHAEASLVARAAKDGISLIGKDLYVTTFPCPICAKLISETGIKRLYFQEGYSLLDGERVLRAAGIELIQVV